jgi:ubiquinone/menaquinone biosynthesis C-methylase UbiE
MNEDKAQFFDSQTEEGWASSPFGPDELSKIDRMLTRGRVGKGMRVIEPGCGTGRLTAVLADVVGPGGFVFASDISENMIEAARKRVGDRPNVCLECASVESTPFDPQTYDAVICHNVFPHFDNKPEVVTHLVSALLPGGRFIVCHFMNSAWINDLHRKAHASVLNDLIPAETDMRAMLESAGLTVESLQDDESGYLLAAIVP